VYIDCGPAARHVGLVDDLIFVSTDEEEAAVVPALQQALAFPEFVPKVQVQSVLVQARKVSLVMLQSHGRILPIAIH
jgi:hypothetical protein